MSALPIGTALAAKQASNQPKRGDSCTSLDTAEAQRLLHRDVSPARQVGRGRAPCWRRERSR